MSVRAMADVWERSNQKGSALLVLLALADWGDDAGQNIYPSIESLARKVRMTTRNVRFIVDRLRESGELIVEQNGHKNSNGQRTNLYRVALPSARGEKITPEKISALKNSVGRGENLGTEGVKPASANPSRTTIDPPTTSAGHKAVKAAGGVGLDQKEDEIMKQLAGLGIIRNSKSITLAKKIARYDVAPVVIAEQADRIRKDHRTRSFCGALISALDGYPFESYRCPGADKPKVRAVVTPWAN
ncbi:MAG: hypothetical protein M1140_07475 [Chloroflexi bacterium]|nr:hypothetical protein [Chloroflexota bacterium]